MEYYNIISKSYNELHKEEQLNKLSIIKANVKIGKGAKILDVGCGTGISSDFECFVVGIDPSIGLLRQNRNIKLQGVAENLPFKSGSFDYVISLTSMHNFSDIQKSISEMKRVGRQNFVFSVLKKSKKFEAIKSLIEENFIVESVVEEERDMMLFCKKHKLYI
ncbi:methyltransferase domain-containing protein [Candidatus Woesearchaeota archaeon]|nr:methyltransferase domain-containing protein [Candidatus Woesearchaeota archaeon]